MIIGAPGVYDWTGTVIRVTTGSGSGSTFGYDFNENRVLNVTEIPQLLANGYLGNAMIFLP